MSGAHRSTAALLLATTALVSAGAAFAQDPAPAQPATVGAPERVVVRGVYIPDEKRDTSEIASVIDVQDYAIMGASDIAAALTRVTGITIAQNKYVYVRGLNERYSNVSLNGSPLPSPEPLRRVAPLDLFPTGLLSSTVVQKTFSPEFSGEFGGGLVAMRTATLPSENFFEVGVSAAHDTATTLLRGYTYYGGGDSDYTGWDDGTRKVPPLLRDVWETQRIGSGLLTPQQETEIARSLVNSPLWVLQSMKNVEPDFGANASGGYVIPLGDAVEFGVLAAAGYSNSWTTKDGLTGQGSIGAGVFGPSMQSHRISTEQEAATNGLLTLGLDLYDDHEIKFTALGVRSTVKGARSSNVIIGATSEGGIIDYNREDRLDWFERELWLTQLQGTHVFPALAGLSAEWRASYAEATRDAPYQREVNYLCRPVGSPGAPTMAVREPDCDVTPSDPTDFAPGYYAYGGRQSDNLTQFSNVADISRDYGADFRLPLFVANRDIELKAGAAWTGQSRNAMIRQFRFTPGGAGIPNDLLYSRIDYIFADPNIDPLRLRLVETGGILFPESYRGDLDVMAYYAGFDAELVPFVRVALGARYEESDQISDTFNRTLPDNGLVETSLEKDYVLPAGTVTWNFAEDWQLRVGASKTLTRPQFRELAFAEFFDPETEQNFRGNPYLVNTVSKNYDARLEYYFGRDQFVTAGVFYKDMANPIEEYAVNLGDSLASSFLNAPSATLWGVEGEFEKIIPVRDWIGLNWNFLDDKDVVFKANYTYTNSEVSADGIVTLPNPAGAGSLPSTFAASSFIEEGRQLQGASEHIVNIQLGYRADNSSLNFLLNYSSDRIRQVEDLANNLPAVMESAPITLDFVYLHDIGFRGGDYQFGVRVNNILGEDYEAYQEALGTRVPVDTYRIGQTVSLSLKRRF